MQRRDFLLAAPAALAAGAAPLQAHEHEAGGAGMPKPAMGGRGELGAGVALAPDGALWMVGVRGANRLYVQRRAGVGGSWEAARELDTAGDAVAADGESRPVIACGPDGGMVVVYCRPLSKPFTGEVRMLRSTDGGRSFAPPFTVHDDRQAIAHRFPAIAYDARGALWVAWIDKRDIAAGRTRAAAIYGKRSDDGGASFGPDRKLAPSSCECCRIVFARTREGGLAALWRHVYPDNVRDHAFLRLDDWSDDAVPTRATFDGWVVQACPHHGPGLASATDGGYHATWFGVRGGRPGVRYGRLDAQGAPQGAPREVPDEAAEHADIAAVGRNVAITWRRYDGRRHELWLWESGDEGAHFKKPRRLGTSAGPCDAPHFASDGRQAAVLWNTVEAAQVWHVLG